MVIWIKIMKVLLKISQVVWVYFMCCAMLLWSWSEYGLPAIFHPSYELLKLTDVEYVEYGGYIEDDLPRLRLSSLIYWCVVSVVVAVILGYAHLFHTNSLRDKIHEKEKRMREPLRYMILQLLRGKERTQKDLQEAFLRQYPGRVMNEMLSDSLHRLGLSYYCPTMLVEIREKPAGAFVCINITKFYKDIVQNYNEELFLSDLLVRAGDLFVDIS